MKLVIISGRSGSGKSTALNLLEDQGYYCIDNLPVGLMSHLVKQAEAQEFHSKNIAVSIDARNLPTSLSHFPDEIEKVKKSGWHIETIFLDAKEDTLISRFSATRRKHPLSSKTISLAEAIKKERALLDPIYRVSDLNIDTTHLSMHQLRSMIKSRVMEKENSTGLALLFQSFGFKHGIPVDADFMFDVRCLPNPYWDPTLRNFTGQDVPVIEFLRKDDDVGKMIKDISTFVDHWVPKFEENNRSYMTIAIGCTGGQHRSVFISESLANQARKSHQNVQVRHRELDGHQGASHD